MWTRHFRASLLALPLLAGTAAAVQAAPQILGIVASNGLPTPLHCADGYCSAYLASFCLQEARYAPNKGSEYRLAPGGRLTIIASLGDGRTLRLPAQDLLTIRARSGFTSLWLSIPEARLKALGATAAAVEVGPKTTVLPLAYAGDPRPQSADEVATAAGPLRQIAAETFDRPGEAADTARLIELVINRLPDRSQPSSVTIAALWGEVAASARQSGIAPGSIEATAGVIAECEGSAGTGFAGGVCLEMRQAELMTNLNRRFWDQAAGGS
jgi:hypothetical protein